MTAFMRFLEMIEECVVCQNNRFSTPIWASLVVKKDLPGG